MAQWLNHPNSSISTCSNSENTNSGKLYPAARLMRAAATSADAYTIADHLTEPSAMLTLAYVGAGLGLVSANAVAEWYTAPKEQSGETSIRDLQTAAKRIEQLIQLQRAGEHLAADQIVLTEQLPETEQLQELNRITNALAVDDERRPRLLHYALLKSIQIELRNSSLTDCSQIKSLETTLLSSLNHHHQLQVDLVSKLAKDLGSVKTECDCSSGAGLDVARNGWFSAGSYDSATEILQIGTHRQLP